jgi:hypothetical protein
VSVRLEFPACPVRCLTIEARQADIFMGCQKGGIVASSCR